MKASETTLIKFIDPKIQFVIPIFQRTYNWEEKHCQQLWDDIIRIAQDDMNRRHFIGSIVYIQEEQPPDGKGITQLLIIDGQQRLATIILLLKALTRQINENRGMVSDVGRKVDGYLFNNDEYGEFCHKLILTKADKDTLNNILDNKEQPNDPSSRITENYEFFMNKVRTSGVSINAILRGIERLSIVGISLDRRYDNPQLIFESLNSTGMNLSQADLIRNYILMGLRKDEQETLYNKYWYPMQQTLETSEHHLLERFLRYYVIAKTGEIPNFNDTYSTFKTYIAKQNQTIEVIVADIYKFSKYYARMALLKEEDADIRDVIESLNKLDVYVSYPFLLQVYDDYANNKITKSDFIGILKLVESYIFRRSICGIPAAGLNKIFATLYHDLNTNSLLVSLSYSLLDKNSNRRFPSDEEFTSQFLIKDIYNMTNRSYILEKLETNSHGKKINLPPYSIEHIMPQNLTDKFKSDIGSNWEEVYNKYLHTIGNLTLIENNYNSQIRDYPFLKKRNEGYKKSIFELSRMLANFYFWDEDTIFKRANLLANKALKIWGSPILSPIEPRPPIHTPTTPIKMSDNPQNSNPVVPEFVGDIFSSWDDYNSARELALSIVEIINEDWEQVLSLHCTDVGVMSICLGPVGILKFIRYPDEHLETVFPIDSSIYDYRNMDFTFVEDLPSESAGGRNIKLVRIPWSQTTDLPLKFKDAWHEAIRCVYNQFKDSAPLTNPVRDEPPLIEALIRTK